MVSTKSKPRLWETKRLGDIAKFSSGSLISVSALRNYSPDAPVPVYGGNGIAGYTRRPLLEVPTVVIGRVGQKCGTVYLTNGPAWITDNALYPIRVFQPLYTPFLALVLENAGLNLLRNHNDLPLLTQSILHDVHIALPSSVDEQETIAHILHDVTDLIKRMETLLTKKTGVREAAIQQLLTGKSRLPGFSRKWRTEVLGAVSDPIKGYGLSKNKLTPTGKNPCILYGELFTTYGENINEIQSRTNANEGMPSKEGDVLLPGSTTTSGIDLAKASALFAKNVFLGGDINILRQRGTDYDPSFLAYSLTHIYRKEINLRTKGTTIYHLHGRDLANLVIQLPELPEQRAIVCALMDMDAEIEQLNKKLEKYRVIKVGMMQQLLTGKIRIYDNPK